jgi:NADH-quinone oxidoreductase subunit F
MRDTVLLKNTEAGLRDLAVYKRYEGYRAVEKALKMRPDEVVAEITKSGLRGRGGAGFPTGRKWDRVSIHRITERYLVCNAGEHEPGTFKDRHLLEVNPHQLLEGIIIAAYAVNSMKNYIYINGEYHDPIRIFRNAVVQAREAGYVGRNLLGSGFDFELEIVEGSGSYVAGEETAMIRALEGKEPKPRPKPPYYPTEYGLHGKPTLVNNVETLSNVPHIIRNGADWYTRIGAPKSPGTMLFSLSGAVKRPGVYELPLGTPLRTLIYDCGGGPPDGRTVKAVFPGGPSFSLLTPDRLDTPLDFDALRAAGSGLGSAGVVVFDDTACMVDTTRRFTEFFMTESCGQCPPCKMGTFYLHDLLRKIEAGQGTSADLDSLLQISGFVKGRGDCTVVTGAAVTVETGLRYFRNEFDSHIADHGCSFAVKTA